MKNLPFSRRLGFALAGLRAAWRNEASFRTQAFAGVAALVALAALRPRAVWCALVIVMIALVLAAEMFNTALENLLDRVHPEKHPAIEVAKDCAAGAVLILSVASVAVFVAMLVERWTLA